MPGLGVAGSCALLAVGAGHLLWALDLLLRRRTLTVEASTLQVAVRSLTGVRRWREPLASYRGVRHRRERVYHRYGWRVIHRIELAHPDPRKTVGLLSTRDEGLAGAAARRWSDALGLPLVAADAAAGRPPPRKALRAESHPTAAHGSNADPGGPPWPTSEGLLLIRGEPSWPTSGSLEAIREEVAWRTGGTHQPEARLCGARAAVGRRVAWGSRAAAPHTRSAAHSLAWAGDFGRIAGRVSGSLRSGAPPSGRVPVARLAADGLWPAPPHTHSHGLVIPENRPEGERLSSVRSAALGARAGREAGRR